MDFVGIFHPGHSDDPWWFWPVYSTIDLPFSFGADVILVPYDVYTDVQWLRRTNGTVLIESAPKSEAQPEK
jgi:Protein of unknown function (DUF1375)